MTDPTVTPEMIRAVAEAAGSTVRVLDTHQVQYLNDWADRLEDETAVAESDARTWYGAYRDAYQAATPSSHVVPDYDLGSREAKVARIAGAKALRARIESERPAPSERTEHPQLTTEDDIEAATRIYWNTLRYDHGVEFDSLTARVQDRHREAARALLDWVRAFDRYHAPDPQPAPTSTVPVPRMWAHPDGRLCIFAPNRGTDHQYVVGRFNQWGDLILSGTTPDRPEGFVPVVRPDGVL